jgi:hypothetical protein
MRLPGRPLELRGDAHARGMTVQDRTRLNGRLFSTAGAAFQRGLKKAPKEDGVGEEGELVTGRRVIGCGGVRLDAVARDWMWAVGRGPRYSLTNPMESLRHKGGKP